jgi:hypothetical protein
MIEAIVIPEIFWHRVSHFQYDLNYNISTLFNSVRKKVIFVIVATNMGYCFFIFFGCLRRSETFLSLYFQGITNVSLCSTHFITYSYLLSEGNIKYLYISFFVNYSRKFKKNMQIISLKTN